MTVFDNKYSYFPIYFVVFMRSAHLQIPKNIFRTMQKFIQQNAARCLSKVFDFEFEFNEISKRSLCTVTPKSAIY